MGRQSQIRLAIVAGALVLVGFWAAVWKNSFHSDMPAWRQEASDGGETSAPEAIEVPDALLTTLNEKTTQLKSVLTRDPATPKAILSMWATWCEPCVHELPSIASNVERLRKQGIQVVLINYNGEAPEKMLVDVKGWLKNRNLALDTFFDFKETVLNELKISALPYAIGVDARQRVQWARMGELDWSNPRLKVD